jgi:hypothetical protein
MVNMPNYKAKKLGSNNTDQLSNSHKSHITLNQDLADSNSNYHAINNTVPRII